MDGPDPIEQALRRAVSIAQARQALRRPEAEQGIMQKLAKAPPGVVVHQVQEFMENPADLTPVNGRVYFTFPGQPPGACYALNMQGYRQLTALLTRELTRHDPAAAHKTAYLLVMDQETAAQAISLNRDSTSGIVALTSGAFLQQSLGTDSVDVAHEGGHLALHHPEQLAVARRGKEPSEIREINRQIGPQHEFEADSVAARMVGRAKVARWLGGVFHRLEGMFAQTADFQTLFQSLQVGRLWRSDAEQRALVDQTLVAMDERHPPTLARLARLYGVEPEALTRIPDLAKGVAVADATHTTAPPPPLITTKSGLHTVPRGLGRE